MLLTMLAAERTATEADRSATLRGAAISTNPSATGCGVRNRLDAPEAAHNAVAESASANAGAASMRRCSTGSASGSVSGAVAARCSVSPIVAAHDEPAVAGCDETRAMSAAADALAPIGVRHAIAADCAGGIGVACGPCCSVAL
jgi:hypothetical protein